MSTPEKEPIPEARIDLRQGRAAIIDAEDADRVSQYRWYAHKRESGKLYVKGVVDGKMIGLHRLIMKVLDMNLVVDHKDGDPLNNRKCNLRVCTQPENMRNQLLSKANTCGFKGVVLDNRTGKWRAKLAINKRHIHGGYFFSMIDAAKRYNELAIQHFGEFAHLNKIPD